MTRRVPFGTRLEDAELVRSTGRIEERLLEYAYAPSTDVAADARWLTDVLGGEPVFAIDADGTRVAMVRLGNGGPPILVTDHLPNERPVFLYRLAIFEATRPFVVNSMAGRRDF